MDVCSIFYKKVMEHLQKRDSSLFGWIDKNHVVIFLSDIFCSQIENGFNAETGQSPIYIQDAIICNSLRFNIIYKMKFHSKFAYFVKLKNSMFDGRIEIIVSYLKIVWK